MEKRGDTRGKRGNFRKKGTKWVVGPVIQTVTEKRGKVLKKGTADHQVMQERERTQRGGDP